MKTSSSALLLAALCTGFASSSDFTEVAAQLPECSLECIAAGVEEFDCEISDVECMCGKIEEITAEVSPCMVDAGCDMKDITDVAGLVAGLCANETTFSAADESETNDGAGDQTGQDDDEEDAAARLQGASLVGAVVLAAFAAVL